jgi:polysaccharide export outer membrane protein
MGMVMSQRTAIGKMLGFVFACIILFVGAARRYVARVSAATAILLMLVSATTGCAHEAPYVWVQDLPLNRPTSTGLIEPRGTISIEISGQPTLSGETVVRDDGSYFNPLIGSVHIAGLTPAQATAVLRDHWKAVVVDPVVTVSLVRPAPIRVGVMGEVKNPGSYELSRDHRLSTALLAAGWMTEFAHDDRIFVLRQDKSARRIRIRARDLTNSEPHAAEFQLVDGDLVSVE